MERQGRAVASSPGRVPRRRSEGARSAGWVVDELAVSSQKRDADKKRKGEKRQRKAHPCQ